MAETGTELATIAPPRLPFPKGIEERFGVDRASWKALVEAVWPLAKSPDAVTLALSYCRARKLDPFKRPVHIVPMWNSALQREVETVWPGVSEHRITAARTGQYAGNEAATFGDPITETFRGKTKKGEELSETLTFPEWAQITVYRLVGGVRVAFPGPRCYFREWFGQRKGVNVPNDRWCRAPNQMLEKCAEAAALRRAFPEEIGDEPTAEEMEGKTVTGPDAAVDITPPRPKREDYKAYEVYDETGVLIETVYSPEEWKVAYTAAKERAGDESAIVEANAATIAEIYGSAQSREPAAVTQPPDAPASDPSAAASAPATEAEPVAQRTEHLTSNQVVAGSTPAGLATPAFVLVDEKGETVYGYQSMADDARRYMDDLSVLCSMDKQLGVEIWQRNYQTTIKIAGEFGLRKTAIDYGRKYGTEKKGAV